MPPILFGMDFLDEPNWAKGVIVIPWELYQVYGDTSAMSANFGAMVNWLDDKAAHEGNIPGLGDWTAAQSTTPQAVIDYGYYQAVDTMAQTARVLGKTSDAAKYSALAASLAAEYNTKYLHTDSAGGAWYANNTEASNAVALDAGLVPAKYQQAVVDSLVAAVKAYGDRIGTGSVALPTETSLPGRALSLRGLRLPEASVQPLSPCRTTTSPARRRPCFLLTPVRNIGLLTNH